MLWMIRLHASTCYWPKSIKLYLHQIPLDFLFNQLSKECVWWSQVFQAKISAGVHLSSVVIWMRHEGIFSFFLPLGGPAWYSLTFLPYVPGLESVTTLRLYLLQKNPDFLDSQKCVQWLNTSDTEQKEYICSSIKRPHYAEKWNWVKFLGAVSLSSFFEANGLRPINTS